MKFLKWIANNILTQIIVTYILGPLFVSGISKIRTGNWFSLFYKIPLSYYIIFFLIITLFCFFLIIIKLRKNLQKNKPIISHYSNSYTELCKYSYAGVLWVIKSGVKKDETGPEDLIICIPPRCPKCKTELEELPGIFGSYIWKCVNTNCKFKKRNRDNFEIEKERALKTAKRVVESGAEESEKENKR